MLVVTNTMGRAGAEKSLIALLRSLDYGRVTVHLLSIVNRGELFADIPKAVKVIGGPPNQAPVLGWSGAMGIARIAAGRLGRGGLKCLPAMAKSAFRQLRARRVQPDKLMWPMLSKTTPPPAEAYDLAVAFLEGAATYYVAEKVTATHKIAFVHVNYDKAGYDKAHDHPYYAKIAYICCVSDGILDALRGTFPEFAPKMRLFPNIVDPAAIRAGAEHPGGFSDDFNGVRLLTVARLHPQKGLDMAIEAMAKAVAMMGNALRWYVIGEGLEKPRLRKLITRYGLEGQFILLGARDNPYPYTRQCDIYVQPSAFEGLSLTLLEALLLHKPCITTDFDGMPDLLTDGSDALIVPFSADRLADAIVRLANDGRLRQSLAEGTEHVPFNFSNKTHVLYAIMDGMRWEER